MKKLHHSVWFLKWIQHLCIALLRKRKVIDMLPSFLSTKHRYLFDRRVGRFHHIYLRETIADYATYDKCLALSSLDLSGYVQGETLRKRYEAMLAEGRIPIILDLGANIGLSAFWFSTEFPRAQIVAVEPDRENFRMAELNTQTCANVRLVNGAAASSECNISLLNRDQGSHAFRTAISETGEIHGHSISGLLELVSAQSDDLLLVKIDIEGFEHELFSRNTEWVEKAGVLIVEPHDWMLPGQATSTNLLRALTSFPRDILVDGEHVISFRL